MSEHKSIFYDPTRKRWRRIKQSGTVLALLSVGLGVVFFISLMLIPVLPSLPGITSLPRSQHGHVHQLSLRQRKLRQFILDKTRHDLATEITKERTTAKKLAIAARSNDRIVAAFYAPWQETGLHSLAANADKMTHVMPAWLQLTPDGSHLDTTDWNPDLSPHNLDVVRIARTHGLRIIPVLSNAQNGEFYADRVHDLLIDPKKQMVVANELVTWINANHFDGVNVDFENLNDEDYPLLIPFLKKLRIICDANHLQLATDIEAAKHLLDWKEAAALSDFVVVMAYDEHGSTTVPGPIASIEWYRKIVERAASTIPSGKLVMGLANYAYDWQTGTKSAEAMSYQQALITAEDNRPGETPQQIIDFDEKALNPTFTYTDDEQREHEVWMLDAVTTANQWMIAQQYHPRGAAFWVLGLEDPSVWNILRRGQLDAPPPVPSLKEVVFPYAIDFMGDGEVLRVQALPKHGARDLETDPQTGLLLDEEYTSFPTAFVLRRTGFVPKAIALTIDDGPAAPYTNQLLDELKQLKVPATFFLIGENAERYPEIVQRIYAEGHEIGNHSFTHPNIGTVSEQRAKLELNSTQRVIQSITGHSTLFFRPPYNADAEPTSAEELQPIVIASRLGYLTIGEYIDPLDWDPEIKTPDGHVRKRTAQDIAALVVARVNSGHGNTVLLHDGGGNRVETVKALPLIVNALRKEGYTFIRVSDMIHTSRDAVMPPIAKMDNLLLKDDRVVFEVMYLGELFLEIAFISAIILATLRIAIITILGVVASRREKRRTFAADYKPSVSVVIAAYNEENVIARTIESIHASDYGTLEIIVVDDGSKDGTSAEVERLAQLLPGVHLIRQENHGKGFALNTGIENATGEIVVAIDADTMLAKDAISKLVRRFADPQVGAVAGNVKVGNRINTLTHWQSIEYITSQNLDRRAWALLNAVTVVPGAIGAWRRTAILETGGFHFDTLAEDMDLTWRVRRAGWRIETENDALAYTEVPDNVKALFRQRFRWAYGTLQSLWKHRDALGREGWFGRLMLPSLWLFQIGYQILSPLVDFQIAWTLFSIVETWVVGSSTQHDWIPLLSTMTDLATVGAMYVFFFLVEFVGAYVAFGLDGEKRKPLAWLFFQRLVYRQLMYAVILKSIATALKGIRAGWGKLDRKGTVTLQPAVVAPEVSTTPTSVV